MIDCAGIAHTGALLSNAEFPRSLCTESRDKTQPPSLSRGRDAHRFRAQVARLPIWYVKLATNRVTGDAKAELLRRFLSIARKAGITNISEGSSLNDWAKRMGAE